jgi:hypothetical protein
MISEEQAEKAAQWLVDNAEAIASARANRSMLEHKRKAVVALVMATHASLALGAQEREAHASSQYQDWLVEYEKAVFDDEKLSALAEGAKERVRLFQTFAANARLIR